MDAMIFKKAGGKNSRNKEYQLWQQDNHASQLETVEFTLDKLNYMHNNPVKAGVVDKAEEYLLSSARDYHFGKGGLLPIQHLTAAYTLRLSDVLRIQATVRLFIYIRSRRHTDSRDKNL